MQYNIKLGNSESIHILCAISLTLFKHFHDILRLISVRFLDKNGTRIIFLTHF